MTVYVHRNRQGCYVARFNIYVNCKGSDSSPEPFRSNPKPVYLIKYLHFKVRNMRGRIMISKVSEQRLFGQCGSPLEVTAYTYSYNNRGTGVCPCPSHCIKDKLPYSFNSVRGLHHPHCRGVLAPSTLGSHLYL